MNNPFADTEWKTSAGADILPPGDHIVTIDDLDGTETSSGGYPQIVVNASNDQGSIRDWLVTIPSATFRAASLFAACELEKPEDDQVKEDGQGFRISPGYLDQCVGKKVGVIVRTEPKYNDPSQTRTVVKGWVKASEISSSDLPSFENGSEPSKPAQDDGIPF